MPMRPVLSVSMATLYRSDLADQFCRRDFAAIENQLGGGRRADTELVSLLPTLKP